MKSFQASKLRLSGLACLLNSKSVNGELICRSRSNFCDYLVLVLVAYTLWLHTISITLPLPYIQCRSNGYGVTVSNRRQYRRQSFYLLCVYNEVLGPLAMRQSHHSFYLFGLPIDKFDFWGPRCWLKEFLFPWPPMASIHLLNRGIKTIIYDFNKAWRKFCFKLFNGRTQSERFCCNWAHREHAYT